MQSLGEVQGQRVVVTELAEDPGAALASATNLRLEAMTAPDPKTLGARDVLVRVRSGSVGWVDLLMTSGQYQHLAPPPYCPGLEWAGEVIWTGAAVREHAIGDRVLVDPLLAGPRSSGPYRQYGGFATFAVAPADAIHRIPGDLDFDEACNLLGSYETAYHCLVARGRLRAGETVLVLGASGATGLAAVHVAKLLGATVIASGRSPEKLAVVKAQGADHVVNAATMRAEVKAVTGGRGVDVVYDGVGGDLSIESLRCVRFGARFLIVGWASTPWVARGRGERGAPNANQLPTNLVMMKGLDVLGCPTVIGTQNDPSLRPPRLAQIFAWAEEGKIRPLVSHRFALAEFREALQAKWTGAVIGGSAIRP